MESLVLLVAIFARHTAEELWQQLGHENCVHIDHWPKSDSKYLQEDTVTIAVQVNGKLRATINAPAGSGEDDVVDAAKKQENVEKYLSGKEIRKVIYVKDKLLNLVV